MAETTQKIGTGRSVVNRHERTFKRGSLMFIEGEQSAEMFIIRNGKIRILKQEGETTIELAILGSGSVLGELSLLDHQPRSATAQIIEDTSVTVIDEELLQSTLEKIPAWLRNIVQVVVKRLRDTMKRTSDDVVRKSISGSIKVMLLLLHNAGQERNGSKVISLASTKEHIYASTGLSGLEAENVFLHLILKDMMFIRKSESGEEFIAIKDTEILSLYMNYLRAHQRGVPMLGEALSEGALSLIAAIRTAGGKNGKKIQGNFIRVTFSQVEIELERSGKGRKIDPNLLDEILASKILIKEEVKADASTGTHSRSELIYNEETLKRVALLQTWLPTFKEEISW